MNTADNYRYPGSRPFQDTDYDRRLFFGREAETQALLHLVLAEKLVVLFGKSGMGKTSLLNAGLCQLLRERNFMPLPIRFNVPEIDPLRAVFTGIQDIAAQQQFEYTPGPATTLWEYFQTAEFWSDQDTLLTPVLILDQFEDFFDFHAEAQRLTLIAQLAELLGDHVSHIKIMVAIREDYLGQLEEMSRHIPAILQNRFRLTALTRRQAKEAIINPAQVQAETIHTNSFGYAPEAVEALLDFLCKRKERDKTVMTNEVEPFQLQLLCQDLETKVRTQQKSTVQTGDLGGESGMQKVLQNFYDRQLKRIRWRKRRRVRKLCEKGLLSQSNRRLSLEEEDITRRFKVKKPMLSDLVNSRLLRAEPRVGSVYYELCHDTLVAPIRKSQSRHKIKSWILGVVFTILMLWASLGLLAYSLANDTIIRGITTCLTIPEKIFAHRYVFLGNMLSQHGRYDKAEAQYRKAIALDPKLTDAYVEFGSVLTIQEKYVEAISQYEKAIELDPKSAWTYAALGNVSSKQKRFVAAILYYHKAIELYPNYAYAYERLGNVYTHGEIDKARQAYRIAYELYEKDYQRFFLRGSGTKIWFAERSLMVEQVDQAYVLANEANRMINKNRFVSPIFPPFERLATRFLFVTCLLYQQKRGEALTELQALLAYYHSFKEVNEKGWDYETLHNVISMSQKLSDADKTLLLKLIDLLEAPKAKGDTKLKELEAGLGEMFKQ